jgi:hypothetical protein
MSFAYATRVGSVLIVAATLGGCYAINPEYTDRRDSIALSAGDAVATNKLTQMVDPWPRASANRNIAFNGEKMQSAVERYRTNKVTNPVSAMTSSTDYKQQQAAPVAATSGKP